MLITPLTTASSYRYVHALTTYFAMSLLPILTIGIALILTTINAMGFSRCDKFGKANNILGNVSSGITSRVFSGMTGRFFR
jgi:hypothetical protein